MTLMLLQKYTKIYKNIQKYTKYTRIYKNIQTIQILDRIWRYSSALVEMSLYYVTIFTWCQTGWKVLPSKYLSPNVVIWL